MDGMTTRVTFTFADGHTEDIEIREDAHGHAVFTAPEGATSAVLRWIPPGGECQCKFTAYDPADYKPGEEIEESCHYRRACRACGHVWWSLHCPHDGIQQPCGRCGRTDPGTETPMQALGLEQPPGLRAASVGGMGDRVAIDVSPDQIIEWFATYPESERQRRPVGNCTHACAHRMTKVVAWGPDYEHYELHVCDDPDGCKSDCRGWTAGIGATSYELLRCTQWKLLAPAS